MSVPNEELEVLVKKLNSKNKVLAKSFLSWLLDQQFDEEDMLTEEEIKAIKRARKDQQEGKTISLEDIKREFQL
ncbi:hypothetical protein [Paenibacillus sanguinis]|uniref:hypothetical protein n=1 Tax=Paenibacillus sanguinis TaxID=225906 RepID=UPI000369CCF5|nr:hypothetical protein [Paenibacillus sanguinis]